MMQKEEIELMFMERIEKLRKEQGYSFNHNSLSLIESEYHPHQHSYLHGDLTDNGYSYVKRLKRVNMPQEFGKITPDRIGHSPTMTP